MSNLMMEDIQHKYIRGISILDLAEEYGVSFSKMQKLVKPIKIQYDNKQILDLYKQTHSCEIVSENLGIYCMAYVQKIANRDLRTKILN